LTGAGVTLSASEPKPATRSASEPRPATRLPDLVFVLKKSAISAFIALVLFSLMIGIRTEAGPTGQLIYWTRFGDLAAIVAAVFGGSIVIELLRTWWGPVGTINIVPPSVQSSLAIVGRLVAPALLIFTLLVPVFF
jgi:branched-chain amino acid transport system permease protein